MERIKEYAKKHTVRQTLAEELLWGYLAGVKFKGLYFLRQHPVESMILDFFCPKAMVAIEVDGGYHDNTLLADIKRDQYLYNRHGIEVIRVSNETILNDVEDFLRKLERKFGIRFFSNKGDRINYNCRKKNEYGPHESFEKSYSYEVAFLKNKTLTEKLFKFAKENNISIRGRHPEKHLMIDGGRWHYWPTNGKFKDFKTKRRYFGGSDALISAILEAKKT